MDQERHELVPGRLGAEAGEFGVQVGQEMFDVVKGSDVLVGAQPFGRWKVEGEPPIAVVVGKGVAGGRVDVMAMENAVEAVLNGGWGVAVLRPY